MLIHNFKYALKTLFKNKMLIFWTFAFPIILGTFFQMAFSDIENNEKLDTMHIAIVETEQFLDDAIFQQAFQSFEKQEEDALFSISYVENENAAEELLDKDQIIGYFLLESDLPKVVVRKNGVYQTIFQYVVDEIVQSKTIFQNIVQAEIGNRDLEILDYEKIYIKAAEMMKKEQNSIVDISSHHLSYTMIEFYTLIAMTCLYGGILGMTSIHQVLPNMSSKGKRVSVSPVSKGRLIFSSVLASFFVQLIGVLLLFLYTVFVLHVDYGTHLGLVVLLSFMGSFAGLSLGIMIATVFRTNESTKLGIVIAVTMLGCFLSGMMGITMKYVVDKNIPIINQLNPANMITDGFYALYYYDTFDRFYFNVMSLLIFSFIMIGISFLCLRRQKYDSI